MNKLLSTLISAAIIAMPLTVISTPVAAQTPNHHVQTTKVKQAKKAHKAKAKHKIKKAKKAKKAKAKKSANTPVQ